MFLVVVFALFSFAFAFDGSEMDAILPIVTGLVAGGTAIVIALGVYKIGARVYWRVVEATMPTTDFDKGITRRPPKA